MFMLGGLIVWAAHFFTLYAVASIFPGERKPVLLALFATLAALAADGLLLRLAVKRQRQARDRFDHWTFRLAAGSAAISLLAVAWQGLPSANLSDWL